MQLSARDYRKRLIALRSRANHRELSTREQTEIVQLERLLLKAEGDAMLRRAAAPARDHLRYLDRRSDAWRVPGLPEISQGAYLLTLRPELTAAQEARVAEEIREICHAIQSRRNVPQVTAISAGGSAPGVTTEESENGFDEVD